MVAVKELVGEQYYIFGLAPSFEQAVSGSDPSQGRGRSVNAKGRMDAEINLDVPKSPFPSSPNPTSGTQEV